MPQFVVKALLKKSVFKGFKKEFSASFKRDIELKTYISDFWFAFFLGKNTCLKVNFTCYKAHSYCKKFRGQMILKFDSFSRQDNS